MLELYSSRFYSQFRYPKKLAFKLQGNWPYSQQLQAHKNSGQQFEKRINFL